MDFRNSIYINAFAFDKVSGEFIVPNHFHNIYELFYCIEGQVIQTVKDETICMKAGDYLFIKAGDGHRLIKPPDTDLTYFVFHFHINEAQFQKLLGSSNLFYIPRNMASSSAMPFLARRIYNLVEKNGLINIKINETQVSKYNENVRYSSKLSLEANLLLTISEYISLVENGVHNIPVKKQKISVQKNEIANRIADVLENNIRNPFSINEISKEMGISRSQCTKIFTEVYAVTPKEYLSKLRFKVAKDLLEKSTKSIELISENLGFSSVSHFSRQFKNRTGISPNKFRLGEK